MIAIAEKHLFELILAAVVLPCVGVVWALIRIDISAAKKMFRASLYHEDGTTVYVPRAEFKTLQHGCQLAVCKKIDELKAVVLDVETKREDDAGNVRELIGLVKEHIRNDAKGG